MKIFWDPRTPIDFNPKAKSSQVKKTFESYLREALEADTQKAQNLDLALNLVEEILPILEKLSGDPISRSQAETLADVLAERARQLEELLSGLPEGPLRQTLSEAALLFGVEAEKLRKGYYV